MWTPDLNPGSAVGVSLGGALTAPLTWHWVSAQKTTFVNALTSQRRNPWTQAADWSLCMCAWHGFKPEKTHATLSTAKLCRKGHLVLCFLGADLWDKELTRGPSIMWGTQLFCSSVLKKIHFAYIETFRMETEQAKLDLSNQNSIASGTWNYGHALNTTLSLSLCLCLSLCLSLSLSLLSPFSLSLSLSLSLLRSVRPNGVTCFASELLTSNEL